MSLLLGLHVHWGSLLSLNGTNAHLYVRIKPSAYVVCGKVMFSIMSVSHLFGWRGGRFRVSTAWSVQTCALGEPGRLPDLLASRWLAFDWKAFLFELILGWRGSCFLKTQGLCKVSSLLWPERKITVHIFHYILFASKCNRVIFQENQVPRGQTKNCRLPYREVTLNYATLNPWRLK